MKKYNQINKLLLSRKFTIIFWIVLVLLGAFILYIRYPYAFTQANFYAEDGNNFAISIINDGYIIPLFKLFNGYLIFFQYLLLDLAFMVNGIFGNGIVTLPKYIALVSYLAFSLACSLPWLLFRKKIGNILSVLLVLMLLFTPLGGSDYAVLGTIGNLKFLFMYIATLLIIYRNDNQLVKDKSIKLYFIDGLIFMCVLTNILVLLLLPLGLIRYKDKILLMTKSKKLLKKYLTPELITLIVLIVVSFAYSLLVYIKGIPKFEGYLDGPIQFDGLVNALFRSSWYGVLYPLYTSLNIYCVIALLLIMPLVALWRKYRFFSLSIIWAILVASLGFIVNRPGVTEYMKVYNSDGGPGQFFYACTMIFIFGLVYILAPYFNNLRLAKKLIILYAVFIYIIWAFPLAGSRGSSFETYSNLPTISESLSEACIKSGNKVNVSIYPSDAWSMTINRSIACRAL